MDPSGPPRTPFYPFSVSAILSTRIPPPLSLSLSPRPTLSEILPLFLLPSSLLPSSSRFTPPSFSPFPLQTFLLASSSGLGRRSLSLLPPPVYAVSQMTMCKLRAQNPVAHQPKLFSTRLSLSVSLLVSRQDRSYASCQECPSGSERKST